MLDFLKRKRSTTGHGGHPSRIHGEPMPIRFSFVRDEPMPIDFSFTRREPASFTFYPDPMFGDDIDPNSEADCVTSGTGSIAFGAEKNKGSSYGRNSTGTPFNPQLGSMDPFANADFGDDEDPFAMETAGELSDGDNEAIAEQAMEPDEWGPPEQVPVLRNPEISFGDEYGTEFGGTEFYSGVGPAAIIGCDMGVAGTGLKK
jgi:hypothetical protein